jgi:BirA family transcriptional regulator, biotin operon repressor / biotin---[acetyl-CoA-carboxylase] ligase
MDSRPPAGADVGNDRKDRLFLNPRLTTRLTAAGHRAIHHASLLSTMSEAMLAAKAGEADPLWIIADEQSAGRGRQGRAWHSPPGNLHATLLLVNPCQPQRAAELGFVAGLALHDAACAITGLSAPRLQLKWPNDLLLDGAKCAGLLLEGATTGAQFTVAIGLGVNVVAAPDDTPYPATFLSRHAHEKNAATRDALMLALAGHMAARLAEWREAGFATVLQDWRARAAFLGETITIRLPDGAVTGRFDDIDASGRLKLLTPQGLRVIDAGDLFFPAAP